MMQFMRKLNRISWPIGSSFGRYVIVFSQVKSNEIFLHLSFSNVVLRREMINLCTM